MALLAAYSFGGSGSTIADDSGNGRSFTLDANTVRAAGGGLTRLNNGSTVGPSLTGLQTANRSISCRVARTSTSVDGWFPTFDSSGTGVWGLIDLGGQRQARGRNAGGVAAAQQASTTGEVALAATYDGTDLRLYVGGALVATTALAGPMRTDATQLLIFATTGTETVMKDLRIYSHTLNLTEVQADRDTPVSAGGTALTLGQAAETDTAKPFALSKALTVGQAAETATARPVTLAKTQSYGPATETDSAKAVVLSKALGLGAPGETDTAKPLALSKALGFSLATETDAALAGSLTAAGSSPLPLAVATEADTARPFSLGKQLAFGRPTEVDTSRAWFTVGPYTPASQPVAVTRNTDGTATTRPVDGTATTRPVDGTATTQETE